MKLEGDQVNWVKDGKGDGTSTIVKGNPNNFCSLRDKSVVLRTVELRSSNRTAGSNATEGERTAYKSSAPQKFYPTDF